MPPNQAPSPGQQNPYQQSPQDPYAFIMNNEPPKKGNGFNFSNNSMAVRIAVVVFGLMLLIIAFTVINSFISRSSNAQTDRLIEVAQAQTEIMRVSRIAEDDASDLKTRTYAYNVSLSTDSSLRQVKSLLQKRGKNEKSLAKTLGAGKNAKTDAALEEAKKNNRFDDTFLALMNNEIVDYQKLIQAAYESGNNTEKKTLTTSFESTKYLVAKTTADDSEESSTTQE